MAGGVYKGVLIAAAADGAGVGGIAHVGAVRLLDDGIIRMLRLGDGLGVALATVTGEGHDPFFCAGCFLGDGLGVGVAQGVGVVAYIAVAATLSGAGIGGVAHFVMGGSGYDCLIIVAQGLHQAVHVAVVAAFAGVLRVAGSFAGGGYDSILIIMAQSWGEIVPMVVTATFTDVLRIAVGGAGGIYDHMGVVVCQCRNFAGLPIVAAGACAGFDAGLQAGGFLCYGPLAQVMAQYRDHCAADNELAAVTAVGVAAVAFLCAGSRHGIPNLCVIVGASSVI